MKAEEMKNELLQNRKELNQNIDQQSEVIEPYIVGQLHKVLQRQFKKFARKGKYPGEITININPKMFWTYPVSEKAPFLRIPLSKLDNQRFQKVRNIIEREMRELGYTQADRNSPYLWNLRECLKNGRN